LKTILQLAWLLLPLVLAGLVHLVVLKRGLLAGLGRLPIDGGMQIRGRPLFGANKTWRGALVTIAATSVAAALLAALNACCLHMEPLVPFSQQHPWAWGALLGAGFILGELPNSFVKRQLGIAPGEAAPGALMPVFWVIDQLDSLAGVLLLTWPIWHPSPAQVAGLTALMLIGHPVGAWIMVHFGLKDRVG
jgi:hypothetical protein